MKIIINYWIVPGLSGERSLDSDAKAIVEIVCGYAKFNKDNLSLKSRNREIVTIRQLIAFFLKNNCSHLTLAQIAMYMGNKDHSLALYSIRKIEDLIEVNYDIRKIVGEIKELINQSKEKQAA